VPFSHLQALPHNYLLVTRLHVIEAGYGRQIVLGDFGVTSLNGRFTRRQVSLMID
jgi:hypothetical protein